MNSATDLDFFKGYDDLSNEDLNIIWTKSNPNIKKISRVKKFENFDLIDNKNNALEFNEKIINNDNDNIIKFNYFFEK